MNGVVTAIEGFGRELVKRGHEVHVFAPKADRREHYGMIVHSCSGITFKPYPEFKIAVPIGVKVPELDLVHTHGPFSMGIFGLKIAKKQKIPKVSTFHTLLSEYVIYLSRIGRRITEKIAEEYCNYHYKKYDAVTTPSKVIKDSLPPVIRRKATVIPNGVDLKFLRPVRKAKEKLGLEEFEKVYLCLGRLGYEKSIDDLIKAASYFLGDEDVLIIAGRGPAEKQLKELVKKLKLRGKVKFAGFVAEKEKPLYYSAADLFITASTTETYGMTVIEAMACGTPVVAADASAFPELIIEGYNGYLFSPHDPKSLARVIKYHKFPRAMRKNARKFAENYSHEKAGDLLEKVYFDLL